MEPGWCSVRSQGGSCHKRGLDPAEEQFYLLKSSLCSSISSPSARNVGICLGEQKPREHSSVSPLPIADAGPRKRFAQSLAATVSLEPCGLAARPETGCSVTSVALSADQNAAEGEKCLEKDDLSNEILKESSDWTGTDWSWLYELDDFGKPSKVIDDHDPAEMLENDEREISGRPDGRNALEKDGLSKEGCNDVSFKESFYSSGSDWSCLYDVDDYGMPCQGNDDRDTEERKADGTRIGKVVGKPANKRVCGKLVQSSLTACWESKSTTMVKSTGSESVAVESKLAAPPASEFWAKFKSPSASASPVVLGIHSQSEATRRQSDMKAVATKGRNCPFYKKIPGTSFTVDAFRYGSIHGCSAYFLTHFHSDHYGGLTKSWSHGPIYCTPVTGRLLVLCLYVDDRWICPVPVGTTLVVEGVEVKLLEANHCPGAAIILFRLKNGQSILHTGDFRACKSMQSYPELRGSHINTLFLDTTYCNPRYRFPPQKEVIDFVVQVTQAGLKKNSRTLIVVGAYSIGKEHVYLGIAEALKIPIFVEKRRGRILRALEWPELANRLCADAGNTKLHVLPIGFLRPEKLKTYLQAHPRFTSVLAFRPTGWTYSEKIGNQLHLLKPVVSGPATIYGVPYSEHSSFTELRDFVQFLCPEKVIPTVNNGRPQERDRMQSYFRQWLMKSA